MIEVEITKGNYCKTHTEDGVIHIPDTSKEYTYYEASIQKVYFIEQEIEMLKELRKDLLELSNEIDKEIKRK